MKDKSFKVRAAVLDDLDAILRLDQELFGFDRQFDPSLDPDWTFSEEGLAFFKSRITREKGAAFVAECEGGVVGYLCAGLVEGESYRTVRRLAELECMVVSASLRGAGLGSALVDAFLAWAREQQVTRAMVIACAGNRAAAAFYRRMGFEDYDLVLERPL